LIVLKRINAIMLAAAVMCAALGLQTVSARAAGDAQAVEQARAKVASLGVGERARVEVKLRDDTKLKGYVSAAGADSFTVTDAKTGAARNVAYADVAQVKKPASGLSPLTWGIIGGVTAAALIVGLVVVKPVLCDGGAGC
jgi:hypothetical protein